MALCIPRPVMDKLKEAFKAGEISIEKLYNMTDKERHTLFSHYLGEDFAREVNVNFEKAMLSSQKDAFTKFVNKTFDKKDVDIRSALEKKLDKLDKVLNKEEVNDFLSDLVSKKLGMNEVTEVEVNKMIELKKNFEEKRKAIPENSPERSPERIDFGLSLLDFLDFTEGLKERAPAVTAKEIAWYKLTHPQEMLYDMANLTKSALSTLDNSFFGRQGIKELFSPFSGGTKRWAINFAKSWRDIGKQMTVPVEIRDVNGNITIRNIFSGLGDPVMRSIKADILSRPNALNGKYDAAKNGYGLKVRGEEAFPTTIMGRVPGLGRLFKSAEVAFNGAALRMRADLADALIKGAEKNGVDVMDKTQADALGELVGSMTGRGEVSLTEGQSRFVNATIFSIKFLKSNIDMLTAPFKLGMEKIQGKESTYARKQAALNMVQIIGSIASIMTIANILNPGSAETDPRSPNFGKIKIGKHTFDITGGMGSIVTVASRLIPTSHNGKVGFWSRSGTGNWTQLNKGSQFQQTGVDILEGFFEGKAAPMAGAMRDIWKGRDYQGRKVTAETVIPGMFTPIIIQTMQQLKNPDAAEILEVLIADGLGFGVSTPTTKKKK